MSVRPYCFLLSNRPTCRYMLRLALGCQAAREGGRDRRRRNFKLTLNETLTAQFEQLPF